MSFCLILLLQIFMYIFNIHLCIFVCANIFGAIVLKPRFKIDAVIMIICSIVIIINSVLTLQVSTASLPHNCGPCEIKELFLCSSTLDSLHTCVCVWSHRVRVRLSGPIITAGNLCHFWGFPQASYSGLSLCRTVLIHTGKGERGEAELTREKVRGAIVHKAGRKY